MPFYYAKVSNILHFAKEDVLPTFMIDYLSEWVMIKHPLAIIDWGNSIKRIMDNPEYIMKFILLSADNKNQLSTSDASSILHLCPNEIVKNWIDDIDCTSEKNIKKYTEWVKNLMPNSVEESSDDEDSSDEEENSDEEDSLHFAIASRVAASVRATSWADISDTDYLSDDNEMAMDDDNYAYDENGNAHFAPWLNNRNEIICH